MPYSTSLLSTRIFYAKLEIPLADPLLGEYFSNFVETIPQEERR